MFFLKSVFFIVCLFVAQKSFSSQLPEEDLPLSMVCNLPDDPGLKGHTRLFVNCNRELFFEHRTSVSQIFCKNDRPPFKQDLRGRKEILSQDDVPTLQQLIDDQRPEMRKLNIAQLIRDKVASLQAMQEDALRALQRDEEKS